ncbi:ABC transporter permease subunit [Geodermatophilus sp. DSM 44513]|uniref:ABC transporter permease subunit n=1 Tax=Geodermatophilus sp. DSM 44513 TaxID=1528104 RepID=UPI00127E8DE3|nr:ABC transporter permease subunit [Geodermatophilus sp. DSM 44513]WNV74553.1 ABC transporter permease subunit [Geodermatophilus sp. DSM 44513]
MASSLQQAPQTSTPHEGGRRPRSRGSTTVVGQVVKTTLLAVVGAIAVAAALPLVAAGEWLLLAVLVLVTALLFWVYLSPRHVPLKYLVPGTLFLLAFQLFPVVYTVSIAFTNYGDAHRGSKEDAVRAIEGASVQQLPDSPTYELSIATEGDPATGDVVFLLTDTAQDEYFLGTAEGLEELDPDDVEVGSTGRITALDGYTVLDLGQATARDAEISTFSVPTDGGAIRNQGLSSAYEGAARQQYDAGCDCITDAQSGQVWTADEEVGYFVDENGDNLAQGWRVGVGLENFAAVVTNPTISQYFFQILVWNLAFAALSVLLTFAAGLFMAVVLNHPRLRGQRLYRSLLILPYAMPAFAMLLVWRDMFNTDFGLVNRLLGLDVNWLGEPWTARVAVLLVQLWMGYPYMFLVATGALQAIPADLTEAAGVDGARPGYAFRTITFPLLLVALSPLLITSFAFNFNNFNAVYLITEGGPFPADNPQAGATDLLITYTYRLAFGVGGAQYGFAAAISVLIFLIVAVMSILMFRRTRALEEVNR